MRGSFGNGAFSEQDLQMVYRYGDRESSVLVLAPGETPNPHLLRGKGGWDDWLRDCPNLDDTGSRLVLVFSERHEEDGYSARTESCGSSNFPEKTSETHGPPQTTAESFSDAQLTDTLASACPPGPTSTGGRRTVASLPFSEETFRDITRTLHIHGSISRAISRADVPVFSREKTYMEDLQGKPQPAYVYNCRSSNAWLGDLALAVTYFPEYDMSFAVMFGCSATVVDDVVSRLSKVTWHAAHPLLMPAIFAELERSRHLELVERTMVDMETRISEVELATSGIDGGPPVNAGRRNSDRRNTWLDTAYIKNGLVTWERQLQKIESHLEELSSASLCATVKPPYSREPMGEVESTEGTETSSMLPDPDFSLKIKERIRMIQEEYQDKVRDCTMRLDGMAMATQWAHGDINVAIAMATNRDSKHMRSIALVTMIFLPGTFCAGVFSMDFFQWDASNGKVVSGSFWVYILFTVVFTLLTVGSWWYFVVHKPSQAKKRAVDDGVSMV